MSRSSHSRDRARNKSEPGQSSRRRVQKWAQKMGLRRGDPHDYWSGRRDLNPRLRPWQGRTLPLSYSRSLSHSTALARFGKITAPAMQSRYRTHQQFPILRCTSPAPHVLSRGCSASSCPCCCGATALDDRRIGALFSQPSCQPVPQVMEPETNHDFTIVITLSVSFLQDPGSDRSRTNIVLHDHAAEPRLFALSDMTERANHRLWQTWFPAARPLAQ